MPVVLSLAPTTLLDSDAGMLGRSDDFESFFHFVPIRWHIICIHKERSKCSFNVISYHKESPLVSQPFWVSNLCISLVP